MMTHSESLSELAPALAKAQAAMKPAVMDCENNQFGSWYAGLSSIMDAVREPLADHGFAVVQGVGTGEGTVKVTTMIVHSSNQWIASELALPFGERATPQAIGSLITYGRRYGLAGLLGVVADADEDGNAAEASSKATPAAAVRNTANLAAAAGESGPDPYEWRGSITKIEVQEGTNAKGKWQLHRVFIGDKAASTFDSKIGSAAEALRKLSAPVVLRTKPGKRVGTHELIGVEEDMP